MKLLQTVEQNSQKVLLKTFSSSTIKGQGPSEDLNIPLQDIVQNFDDDVIIMRWRQYHDTRKNMNNFKDCPISLNMLHTDRLCGVLGFTAPLILISKKFQSKYIYTLNSALCAPFLRAAIKQLLLGA